MKVRTLRGRILTGETKQLIKADGMLDRGFKVERFLFWPDNSAVSIDYQATLGLDSDLGSDMNAGDNRQIGWSALGPTLYMFRDEAVLDPDHLVLEDLFLTCASSEPARFNYLIMLRPVSVTNDESIISLIKSRSQDAER